MRVERRHGGFICVSVKSTSFPEKRGEDDASWWKWCKSLSPTGNTKLMWVTTAKTSKKQRQKGHLKDKAPATPQMWREPRHQNICYTWVKIWVIGDQLNWPKHTFLLCFSIASLPPWVIYIYISSSQRQVWDISDWPCWRRWRRCRSASGAASREAGSGYAAEWTAPLLSGWSWWGLTNKQW